MNKLNYKTRICQFWQSGTCVQGDQCGYAHGKKELRQMPRKTQMCQNVLKGYCQYGDQVGHISNSFRGQTGFIRGGEIIESLAFGLLKVMVLKVWNF